MGTAEEVKNNKKFSLRRISFGRSRAYLAEYGVLLVLVLALINILAMMLQELIGKKASFMTDPLSLPFLPFFSYGYGDMTIGILAAFLVVFPAVIILIQRTAAAESVDAGIKSIGWRKGLLNLFLFISTLWAVVSLVSVLTAGLNYLSLLGTESNSFDWREAAESGFRALLMLLAVFAFSSDYRRKATEKVTKSMHVFRYGITALSLVGLVLFVIFPFNNNRDEVTDNLIVGDLYSIQSKINEQYNNSMSLPNSIDDLKLSDKEKSRAVENGYKYEKTDEEQGYKLCATFKTDTRDTYGKGVPEATYPINYADFNLHNKGEKCFDLKADSYMLEGKGI